MIADTDFVAFRLQNSLIRHSTHRATGSGRISYAPVADVAVQQNVSIAFLQGTQSQLELRCPQQGVSLKGGITRDPPSKFIRFLERTLGIELSDYEKGKVYKFTILHTNDHHGRFWRNEHDEYGLSARATKIEEIRKEVAAQGGQVLLLSGGDINTGVPRSDVLDAEPDFRGMHRLGYDAMAVGNHEFDNSLDVIRKQEDWAGFPFLAANIKWKKKNGEAKRTGPFDRFMIKQVGKLKIGIVGFTTTDTPLITSKENTEDLVFIDPSEVAPKVIAKMKRRGADFIIAVTHMGHYQDGNHGSEAPGDVTLARSVDGIDVIVGGHSQNPLFEPDVQNGTHIVQAQEWGKYVGRMDIEFKDGQWEMCDYRLIPINKKEKVKDEHGESKRVLIEPEIPEDPDMLGLLAPYQEKGAALLAVPLGRTETQLEGDRKTVRSKQTNLGTLICHAIRNTAGEPADVGIYNSGGIRASVDAGEVSYEDVLKVLPFGNTVVRVELTGTELKNYLAAIYANEPGSGGFPQVSGVQAVLVKENETLSFESITVNGEPWDASRTYKVALNSFIGAGGNRYPDLTQHASYRDIKTNAALVLRDYISKNAPLEFPANVAAPVIVK